ncbi:MAG: DUF4437 domain-containing protein [Bacteroidota bacterium]
MKRGTIFLLFISAIFSCTIPNKKSKNKLTERIGSPTNKVILSSEIVWEKLNPARGEQSPQAGTIWGDRNGKGGVATGFLAKFIDGFSSPPHIHNVTYRAVVIKGLVHNDDPNAENMWMKPGSFWTQPVGESHITSAKGEEIIALVEIDNGPYLVRPISEAYDSGERPINIEASNVVWLNSETTNWIDKKSEVEISFLLESKKLKSLFIKLPIGYKGEIEANGTVLHSVIIKGNLNYTLPQNEELRELDIGSYFGSTDKAVHTIENNSGNEIIIYVRTNGDLKVT